jgi:hypothetical protein
LGDGITNGVLPKELLPIKALNHLKNITDYLGTHAM